MTYYLDLRYYSGGNGSFDPESDLMASRVTPIAVRGGGGEGQHKCQQLLLIICLQQAGTYINRCACECACVRVCACVLQQRGIRRSVRK